MPLHRKLNFYTSISNDLQAARIFTKYHEHLPRCVCLPGYAGVTTAELNEKTIAQCGVRLGNQNYSAFLTLEQGSYPVARYRSYKLLRIAIINGQLDSTDPGTILWQDFEFDPLGLWLTRKFALGQDKHDGTIYLLSGSCAGIGPYRFEVYAIDPSMPTQVILPAYDAGRKRLSPWPAKREVP